MRDAGLLLVGRVSKLFQLVLLNLALLNLALLKLVLLVLLNQPMVDFLALFIDVPAVFLVVLLEPSVARSGAPVGE